MAEFLTISDLRGGVNDSESPMLLRPNEMTEARNTDFRAGALGSKRRGSLGISMQSAVFNTAVVAVMRHTPTNAIANDELWAIDANGNIDRRVGGTWQGGVAKSNDFVTVAAGNYDANGVSLHGKFFIAAKGTEDRLLVWDGTVLRWAGIAQPPAPTAADTAGAGTYTGTRYIRIRYTQQTAGVTIRRSEPSTVLVHAPAGNKDGITITKPAGTEATTSVRMEGQTHWEVEASLDNILFYRIATVVVGTATYTDNTAEATGYSSNTLSEQIGEYVVPGAAKHVSVDEDRVLAAGSHFVAGSDATVWWTRVTADVGVGNDERIPTTTAQHLTFDGLDGGGVQSLVAGVLGSVYVFKRSRIYKMVRTGILASAYDPVTESWSRGSTPRGAVSGLDQNGVPCVYFLDEASGLCRIGQRGVEDLARGVSDTWKRRNKQATIHPRIVHYPELDQVWYSVPLDAETVPSSLLFMYETQYGAPLYHDGLPSRARCFTLFPDSTTTLKPVFGTAAENLLGGGTSYIHFGDTGTQDNGVNYQAYGITRPFILGGLFQKFGLLAAALVASASSASILVRLVRNFGIETKDVTVSTVPVGTEAYVVKPMDDCSMSDLNVVQVRFGDSAASSQTWSLEQMVFRPRREEISA